MNVEPLVVTTRERFVANVRGDDPGAIENVHHGSIAVVDADGRLTHQAGDPRWSTFTRSTLKPFQAVPFVREGGHDRFSWTSRELALMCASHSGEAMHTEVVAGMLKSAGCDESALQCGCHVPGWYAATGQAPPPDAIGTPLEHNCSGKHAGFLAACRLHGEPIADYLAPDAPLQRRVATVVSELSGLGEGDLPCGTDGCSAPNYALPLSRLAFLYAQLAQGRSAGRDDDAVATLRDAMMSHPELVSGTARSDRALMGTAPGDWVTKIGADGVQAIGIRSAGIGIAIKIADGNRDALFVAVVAVLQQLGLLPTPDASAAALPDAFSPWFRDVISNARGTPTGRILPAFRLQAS